MSDNDKLVIVLTHNGGHDTSTVGFTIANAALSQGKEVAIFLTADGVDLARDGASDLAQVRPFPSNVSWRKSSSPSAGEGV